MPKLIRTTSNTQTPTPATNQATFAIGDIVLCPSLSNSPFVLTADPYGKRDELTLTFEGSYFYYDDKGYFVPACDKETGDFQPSLYHNTPANQQAINTLYGNAFGTLATFKAGDAVLCPFVGSDSYQLFIDDEHGLLSFIAGVNKYHTRADGKQCPNDKSPSIFHDTPTNRQIITALYSGSQSSQRKVIDTTALDDDEVIVISSHDLSHIACDISGAITVLNDIGQLLALIHYGKIEPHTAISMARLSHDAADTWATLLNDQLEAINDTLAMTRYGKEGK